MWWKELFDSGRGLGGEVISAGGFKTEVKLPLVRFALAMHFKRRLNSMTLVSLILRFCDFERRLHNLAVESYC